MSKWVLIGFLFMIYSCDKSSKCDKPEYKNIYSDDIVDYLPYTENQLVKFLKNNKDTLIFSCHITTTYPRIHYGREGSCSKYLQQKDINFSETSNVYRLHIQMFLSDDDADFDWKYLYSNRYNYKVTFNDEAFCFKDGLKDSCEVNINGVTYDRIINLKHCEDSSSCFVSLKLQYGIFKIVDYQKNIYEIIL